MECQLESDGNSLEQAIVTLLERGSALIKDSNGLVDYKSSLEKYAEVNRHNPPIYIKYQVLRGMTVSEVFLGDQIYLSSQFEMESDSEQDAAHNALAFLTHIEQFISIQENSEDWVETCGKLFDRMGCPEHECIVLSDTLEESTKPHRASMTFNTKYIAHSGSKVKGKSAAEQKAANEALNYLHVRVENGKNAKSMLQEYCASHRLPKHTYLARPSGEGLFSAYVSASCLRGLKLPMTRQSEAFATIEDAKQDVARLVVDMLRGMNIEDMIDDTMRTTQNLSICSKLSSFQTCPAPTLELVTQPSMELENGPTPISSKTMLLENGPPTISQTMELEKGHMPILLQTMELEKGHTPISSQTMELKKGSTHQQTDYWDQLCAYSRRNKLPKPEFFMIEEKPCVKITHKILTKSSSSSKKGAENAVAGLMLHQLNAVKGGDKKMLHDFCQASNVARPGFLKPVALPRYETSGSQATFHSTVEVPLIICEKVDYRKKKEAQQKLAIFVLKRLDIA